MSALTSGLVKPHYAIFRFEKIKTMGELTNRAKHNDRTRVSENVDIDGPPPRSLLDDDPRTVAARAKDTFKEKGIIFSDREGKVLAVEILMTASPGFFATATPEQFEDWVATSKRFIGDKFGDGLIDLMLHLDEETPHLHGFALPIVEKPKLPRGRPPKDPQKLAELELARANAPMIWSLDCDRYFGGKTHVLSTWQDDYHAAVSRFGLARGEKERDEEEIDIGDGILLNGADFKQAGRSRRNITPKEGRKILKKMLADAEREREEIQGQLAIARDQLREADETTREAESTKAHHEALLARIEELRRQQDAEFLEVQRTLADEREETRQILAKAKDEATKLKLDAERDVERQRTQLAEEQRLNDVRLELLERAVGDDDQHGLNLRPTADSFAMDERRMSQSEQAAYRASWPRALFEIARKLALVLEKIRSLWQAVSDKEDQARLREVNARQKESELANKEAEIVSQERVLADREASRILRNQTSERRLMDLENREVSLGQRELVIENAKVEIEGRERELARINKVSAEQNAASEEWAGLLQSVMSGEYYIDFEEAGKPKRLVPDDETATVPPAVEARFATEPPAWVRSALLAYEALARQADTIGGIEDKAIAHETRLRELVEGAGPVLTQRQSTQVERINEALATGPTSAEIAASVQNGGVSF